MMEDSFCDGDESVNPAVEGCRQDILIEKMALDGYNYPIANRLLDEELQKVTATNKPSVDRRYIDLYNDKPIKVAAKILLPAKEFPHINYVGKLLGYRGETLKHLQELTNCRMFILGQGSMSKAREQSLLNTGDPKYAHLSDVLHIEVTCLAPPSEAHGRIANAMNILREFLMPDQEVNFPGNKGLRTCNPSVVSFIEKARQSMELQAPADNFFRRFHKPVRGAGAGPSQQQPGHFLPRALPYTRRNQIRPPQ